MQARKRVAWERRSGWLSSRSTLGLITIRQARSCHVVWTNTLIRLWGKVAFVKLLQIRLVVLVKEQLQHQISHTEQSVVATVQVAESLSYLSPDSVLVQGIANKLGNKGGVGISFVFGQTSLCFINCHLAAGQEKVHTPSNV